MSKGSSMTLKPAQYFLRQDSEEALPSAGWKGTHIRAEASKKDPCERAESPTGRDHVKAGAQD